MKKTSIHFNENGLVRETTTTTIDKNENISPDNQLPIIEEVLKRERGDINFEPPHDFDDEPEQIGLDKENNLIKEIPRRERRNIPFESPHFETETTKLTLEARLQNLEKKQNQIISMLQQLASRIPKFAGYLSMQEACLKFETPEREIHTKMNWFGRVKARPVEKRGPKGQKVFKEEDLVEAMLIDIDEERVKQLKL